MTYIKTFKNGQVLTCQMEGTTAIGYVNGKRIGWIRPQLNFNLDEWGAKPQMIQGHIIVASIDRGGSGGYYLLVDGEYEPVRAMVEAATADQNASERAAWQVSEANKAHADQQRKEREWDALHNEGHCEGYNPYRDTAEAELEGIAFDRRDRHYPEGT